MMAFKAAFIFIAPDTDEKIHNAVINAPVVQLHVVGVKSYQEAERVAKQLVEDGIVAIELCAGFGVEGVAKIKAAVTGRAAVGVVRFDYHPGFDFKSGDDLF